MPRLLWIGDPASAPALRAGLSDHGYVVLHAEAEGRLWQRAARLGADAVVLGGGAAPQRLAAVRALLPQAVLMVLMPACSPVDEVRLLAAGADLVADPDQGSLLPLARLRRGLQRAAPAPQAALRLGPLELEPRPGRVWLHGQPLPLGRGAALLLQALAMGRGGAATRDELARCLGGPGFGRSRRVDVAVWRLRRALQAQGVQGLAIEAVRGLGYRMVWQAPQAAA